MQLHGDKKDKMLEFGEAMIRWRFSEYWKSLSQQLEWSDKRVVNI